MALDVLNSVLEIEDEAKRIVVNAVDTAEALTIEKRVMADEILKVAILDAESIAKEKWLLMEEELKSLDTQRKDDLQAICEYIKKIADPHIDDAINIIVERIVSGWQ